MLNYLVFLLRISLALAAALLLLGVPALSGAAAPTQVDCSLAFTNSPAEDSCTASSITVSGEQCRVRAYCETGYNNDTRVDTVTVPLSDVDDLNNCSGYLTVGSCSG